MIYQRPLKHKVRAWGISRHNNTFIYLLDPKDEKDGGDYFHMVELKFTEFISSRQANEKKIRDWTGLCRDPRSVNELTFAIDKENLFYVGSSTEIWVVNLTKIENIPNERNTEEGDEMTVPSKHMYHCEGEDTHKGHLILPGVTLHKLYDTYESYAENEG